MSEHEISGEDTGEELNEDTETRRRMLEESDATSGPAPANPAEAQEPPGDE